MSALGSLVVKLALEYAEYTKGLDKSEQDALKFAQNVQKGFDQASNATKEYLGGVVKNVAGVVTAMLTIDAVMGKINHSIDTLGSLDDMAQKTGSTVENLSKLQKTASAFDADMSAVDASISKLAKGMATVDDESNKTQKALAALGVSSKDASGKMREPAQVYVEVAKRLQDYKDGAAKTAIVNDLLGKSGADLLPYLNDLAENFDKFSGISADAAKRGADFQDRLGLMKVKSEELWETIALATLPAMNDFIDAMHDAATAKDGLTEDKMSEWADDAALGVARLVDVAMLLPKIFGAVAGSFKVVAADIRAASVMAENANPIKAAYKWATGGDPIKEIRDAVAARNKVLEDANQKYDDLWNKPANILEQALLKRIAERPKGGAGDGGGDKPQRDLNYTTGNDKSAAEAAAAAQKEQQEYAKLVSAIYTKIEASRLELAIDQDATDSQKTRIKIEQELAAGKYKLTEAHLAAITAALNEQQAVEDLVKARQMEKEVLDQLQQSAQARNAATDSLAAEYEMYGLSADARDIAMVKVKNEAALEKYLFDVRRSGKPITEEQIEQLRAEAAMRTEVEQATLAQTKALGYANQLREENKRFAADSIPDDKARTAALLRLDAETWRERIALAGDGTEAQKALQEQYDQWYRNQLLKPQLEADKQMWTSIDQTAHDTFVSIFDSGKSAFDRLRDTLKNGLLDLLYQMTIKRWIINLQTSMAGNVVSGGAGGTGDLFSSASGSGSALGSAGSLISMANTAKNLYSSVSGGLSGMGANFASGIGSGVESMGGFFGSSNMTTFGQGMQGFGLDGSLGGLSGAGQSAGAMLGSAASIFGGVAGGVLGGRAISGGYGSNGAVNTGTAIGAAVGSIVPVIGTALGALVGGLLGGVYNRMFGRKAPEIESQSLRGTFADGALSGETYQNILEKGGWFKSDKRYTEAQTLTDDMVKQFTEGFDSIKSVSSGFAASLGLSADALKDYSKTFDITLTKDEEKNKQAITEFFAGVSDEVARKLAPGLDALTKSGETASAALERLANEFKGTDQVAQLLGFSATALFGSAGLESAKAREQLINFAGGMSALSAQAAFFNQNFLTDAERIKPVAEALDKALGSLGLATIPTTRDEFKNLVNDLVTSGAAATESGAKQLNSLLALAEAFAQVHPQIDAVAEAAAEAAAQSEKAAAAIQAVKDQASTMLSGINDAYSELQKVVGREKSVLQSSVDSHTAAFNKLQSLSQALHTTLDSLKAPEQKAFERAAAQSEIRAGLAIAKAGGPLPDAEKLKDALSAVTQDASGQFSSFLDYMRDLLQTQNDVAQLAGLTDDSLSVEQRSLDALKDQLARLDDIVSNGQAQLDALNGQSIATLSLAQAMAAFQSSIGTAQTNPVVSGTSTIAGFYQELFGRAPDQAGLKYWLDQVANGSSLDNIRVALMQSDEYKDHQRKLGIPGFASGGMFGGGLRIVGENGPELEATGPSRIWSSNQTAALLARAGSGSVDSTALVEEIKALREEVRGLRAEARATAGHTEKATRLWTRVIRNDSLVTSTEGA